MRSADTIVIGAGAAGLAAAALLKQHGVGCTLLEASPRLGGRVHTIASAHSTLPIELGAEFVHGLPQATLDLVRRTRSALMESSGDIFRVRRGNFKAFTEFFEWMEKLSAGVAKQKKGGDQSWFDILNHSRFRRHPFRPFALSYVEGFHGADPTLISYRALKKIEKYAEKIQTDRGFRLPAGYEPLLQSLAVGLDDIRYEHTVRQIHWAPGEVTLAVDTPRGIQTLEAKRAVLAVPLPILKNGLTFTPALTGKERALSSILMGQVTRLTFEFAEPFWQGKAGQRGKAADIGFLLSPGLDFGTWWSTSPVRSCRLVAWTGYGNTVKWKDATQAELIDRALGSLATMFKTSRAHLARLVLEAKCRLWHQDPLFQGAYSYLKVGAGNAMKDLSIPLEETLYFAGEHTHYQGNHATVDGALETGYRAARQILGGSLS